MGPIGDALSTLSIITGLVVALLKIVDWAIRKPTKEKLTEILETAYLSLNDKKLKYFLAFRDSSQFKEIHEALMEWSTLAAYIFFAMLASNLSGELQGEQILSGGQTIWMLIVWFICSLIGTNVICSFSRWLIRFVKSKHKHYFNHNVVDPVGTILAVPILVWQVRVSIPLDSYDTVQAATSGLAAAPLLLVSQVVIVGCLMAIWIVLMLVAMLAVRVSEFFVLRIAESKNGPVIAVSSVFVAIGSIAKILWG